MIDDTGITTDKIIVLTMTDHDKSGHSISTNIGKHFDVMEYRTLITPEQIPHDKINEWFDIFEDGTKAYELDVLNIHQLQDIFLQSVPEHVADEIKQAHEAKVHSIARENEIIDRIAEDKQIQTLDEKIAELEEQRTELTYKLEDYYISIYNEVQPTTVQPFDLHTIVDSRLTYSVKAKWWVS